MSRDQAVWRVHETSLACEIMASSAFRQDDGFTDYLADISRRSGQDLMPLVRLLRGLTLAQLGDSHTAHRARISRNFSDIVVPRLRDLSKLCDRVVTDIPDAGPVDGFANIIDPIIIGLAPYLGLKPQDQFPAFYDLARRVAQYAAGHASLSDMVRAARDLEALRMSLFDTLGTKGTPAHEMDEHLGVTMTLVAGLHALSGSLSQILHDVALDPPTQRRIATDRASMTAYLRGAFRRLSGNPTVHRRCLKDWTSEQGEHLTCGDRIVIDLPTLRDDPQHPVATLGFGYGAHKCPGMPMSHAVAPELLTRLLARWHLETPDVAPEFEKSLVRRYKTCRLILVPRR